MFWVVAWVGLSFIGLAVLAVCAVKVFVAVNGLGRELDRTRRRLAPKHRELRTLAASRRASGVAGEPTGEPSAQRARR